MSRNDVPGSLRGLPEQARNVLLDHLGRLRRGLGGPTRARHAALHEILADLADATEAYLDAGHGPADAADLAVRDFGDPDTAARSITAALRETAQNERSRTITAITVGQALLWCAVFLIGPSDPWTEKFEPLGTDLSDLLASVSLLCAGVLAALGSALSFLRRRGLIGSGVVRRERALTMVNIVFALCGTLALANYLGLRIEFAPQSLSAISIGLAALAVLALLAVPRRDRLPSLGDPFR